MKDSSSPLLLPAPYPPREIWILGAGRFGQLAAHRLSRRHPNASFTVIDVREEKLNRIREELGFAVHAKEVIPFLLARASLPDDVWIIPAVPIHVAYQWLLARLSTKGQAHSLHVPEAVDRQVPNPYRVPSGTVYSSFATFICPDGCNEPEEMCTSTGKPRLGNLFEHLNRIELPSVGVVVVRSWQLAPGVGGYPGNYLESRLDDISQREGTYLVATSCRCHGVIDLLEWSSK